MFTKSISRSEVDTQREVGGQTSGKTEEWLVMLHSGDLNYHNQVVQGRSGNRNI